MSLSYLHRPKSTSLRLLLIPKPKAESLIGSIHLITPVLQQPVHPQDFLRVRLGQTIKEDHTHLTFPRGDILQVLWLGGEEIFRLQKLVVAAVFVEILGILEEVQISLVEVVEGQVRTRKKVWNAAIGSGEILRLRI